MKARVQTKAVDMTLAEWQELIVSGDAGQWREKRAEFSAEGQGRLKLVGLRLSGVDLSGWDFSNCDLRRAHWESVKLRMPSS